MIKPLAEGRPRKLNYLITTAVKQSQEWGALSAPIAESPALCFGLRESSGPQLQPPETTAIHCPHQGAAVSSRPFRRFLPNWQLLEPILLSASLHPTLSSSGAI